jgi:outer membrane receptor protein involved in Fe transport
MNRAALLASAIALTVCSLLAPRVEAQVLYGSLVIDARDESGAAVPGADVTITQTETGLTRTSVSNGVGIATFPNIPPGTYTVKVNISGFRESVTTGVRVVEDTVSRINSELAVGQLTDTVTVTAGIAMLQTDRADVHTEIPVTQLENLPVPIGRNYQSLFVTVPGISPPENMHSVAVNPARGLGFSSNGTTRNANSIRIEGAISNNLWLPHVAAYVPALEAIESVSVTTSTFDADQGLSGGMGANVLIKSGSNQLKGSAFEYHYDEHLKSRPYFLPAEQKKPSASQNQFGGTLGGPVVRDRLFFFGSYQGSLDRNISQRFGTVPTAAMRNGDFSASPNPIYDPLTGTATGTGRTAFPGNIIPRDRFDPIVQKLLADLPLPNQPGLTDNYFVTGPYTFTRHTVDGKVNYNPTNKLGLMARIGWLNYNFKNPAMFGKLGGVPINETASKAGTGLGDTYTITGSGSYVLSPNVLIDTYTGITTIQVLSEPDRLDEKLGLDFLGIPGTNGPDRLYGGWPHFSFNPNNIYSQIGYAGSNNSPYIDDNWQAQYTANVTYTKGAHTFRFGGDIVRQAMNRAEPSEGSGSFQFGGGPTTLSGGASPNQFNTFATFLLGLPTNVSRTIFPFENFRTRSRNWQFSTFVKDQWQPTRKLTASLGVRWDYFPMGTRTTRGMERYNVDTNQMMICGVGSVPTDCGYDIGPGNVSPRLGLAYRLSERIVVRGGYGKNYDPYPLAFVRDLIGNYPSSIQLTVPAPNTFQFASRLSQGIPDVPVPDVSSGIIPVPLGVSARALPDKPKRGYIHSANLTVQSELPGGFTGQAGYVMTRQRDINQIMDANAGQVIGAGNPGRPLFVKFGRTGATGILSNPGWSNYDSLQTSLTRRMSKGFQVTTAYTLSKAFGICCDTLSDGSPRVQALQYFDLNEARLPDDRTHNFQASFVAELPFGPGKRFLHNGGAAAALVGGWQVNGLFGAYSGKPFSVTADGTSLQLNGSNQMADQVKDKVQILGGIGAANPWFDPLAFRPVTDARFGSAGYDSVRGPGYVNLDLSFFRDITVSGAKTIQFRVEVFNVTNTPHFANPNANVSNLQLNPDGTIRNLGGFATITQTTNSGREGIDERLFRLGLRFGF